MGECDVFVERLEDASGYVALSREKAERMLVWDRIEAAYKADEAISGRVVDRVKGGLAVDVGGTHVKILVSGEDAQREFPSGPTLTAGEMVSVNVAGMLMPKEEHSDLLRRLLSMLDGRRAFTDAENRTRLVMTGSLCEAPSPVITEVIRSGTCMDVRRFPRKRRFSRLATVWPHATGAFASSAAMVGRRRSTARAPSSSTSTAAASACGREFVSIQ